MQASVVIAPVGLVASEDENGNIVEIINKSGVYTINISHVSSLRYRSSPVAYEGFHYYLFIYIRVRPFV